MVRSVSRRVVKDGITATCRRTHLGIEGKSIASSDADERGWSKKKEEQVC